MKKTFTLFSALIAFNLGAQPVFQYTNMPSMTAGITATVFIGNKPSSPGSSGAGVTWNFSSITFTAAGTASMVPPSSTPFASSFPGANAAAIVALPTGTVYTYDDVQPTYKDQLGDAISATGGATYTPNPKRHLTFPLNYGNSYTDSYQCISCSPGSFTVTYDAWGTLIVNGKTYNNVARISNMFGFPYYNYYSTNPVYPIFSYDSSPSSSPYATLVEVSGGGVGMKENFTASNIKLSPNPAKEFVEIQNNNFMQIDFEIYDLMGKQVRKAEHLNQGEISKVDLSEFKAGLYFLKYLDEFGNNTFTKLVVDK